MVLMIDNYDSFTYNIVQYLLELGAQVRVVRNDELTLAELVALRPDRIVISPGPCTPDEAGVSVPLVQHLGSSVPMLGVCLGHQAIAQALGARIVSARQIMHGKTSAIHHGGQGVFAGLPNPFTATRYHSLVVAGRDCPSDLEVTAWTGEGESQEIMGLRHRHWPVQGVQFHPESILSEHGHRLLRNFLSA